MLLVAVFLKLLKLGASVANSASLLCQSLVGDFIFVVAAARFFGEVFELLSRIERRPAG
jgi:hypothetical protein